MKVLRGHAGSWPRQDTPSALAVGVFDGLHAGHRAVLAELVTAASVAGLLPGVVTFDPHPLAVVAPERAPAMLTDIDHRVELLGELGVELVAVVGFDHDTRKLTPEQFAVDLLAGTLAARIILAGEDFRFGRDRAGDVAALQIMGESAGFRTIVVPLVGVGRSSSSMLRAMIGTADLAGVTAELGRPHELRGIARREGTGYRIGLPAGIAVPPPGHYAVTVGRDRDESHTARLDLATAMIVAPLGAAPDLDAAMLRVRLVAPLAPGASADEVRAALLQGA